MSEGVNQQTIYIKQQTFANWFIHGYGVCFHVLETSGGIQAHWEQHGTSDCLLKNASIHGKN